jgi:hypothetical protein
MKKSEGRIAGILGTIILHLIAGIIFMSFQLRTLNIEARDEFVVEFAPEEEDLLNEDEKTRLIELPATSVERILQDDPEMLNIARNLANRNPEQINPDDYIDMVKEELIKSGKLGEDNYIDEQKRAENEEETEDLAFETEVKEEKPTASQEMAANYQGLTRIYYDLKGRTHTRLPIPIYKCQGQGKVMLRIEVNQKGLVEKAQVIASESTTSDECLTEIAVKYALISRFNADVSSPRIQTGTLTYHFVAQ